MVGFVLTVLNLVEGSVITLIILTPGKKSANQAPLK
jgi:hypothetical protein